MLNMWKNDYNEFWFRQLVDISINQIFFVLFMPVVSEIYDNQTPYVRAVLLMYSPLHIRSFTTQLCILDTCQRTLPFLWSLTWILEFLIRLSLLSFIGTSLCNFPYSCLMPCLFKIGLIPQSRLLLWNFCLFSNAGPTCLLTFVNFLFYLLIYVN